MKLWLPILLFLSISLAPLSAQDTHWTLFEFSPLTVNPAQTGAFYGTYRLGGIVSDDAFAVDVTQGDQNIYKSISAYIDGPVINGFRKQDWVGFGGVFYGDQSGDLDLGFAGFLFSAAYHLALDKKQKTVLTFGLQGGSTSLGLKSQDVRFADETQVLTPGANGNGRDIKNGWLEINYGMLLKSKPNKKTTFELGVSAGNLNFPQAQLVNAVPNPNPGPNPNPNPSSGSDDSKRKLTLGVQTGLDYMFNKKWSIRPAIRFQTYGGVGTELVASAFMGYKLDPKKDMVLRFGPAFRSTGDAALQFGVDFKQVRAALAYDFDLGGTRSLTGGKGGVELAVSYIGTIFKQPKVDPVIVCPRY